MSRTKTLWIREPYLSQILAGRKTVEVRVGYDSIRRLQSGYRLKLNDRYLVTIRRVSHYADFEEMLAHEDPATIAPGPPGPPGQGPSSASGQALQADELLAALRQLYPAEKEALGAVALEVSSPLVTSAWGGRYDAILFDMGYTLVYFEPRQELIVQDALRAAGVERSVDEILTAVKVVWGEYYRDAASISFPATPEYDREAQSRLGRDLLAQLEPGADAEVLQVYSDSLESSFNRPGAIRPYPEAAYALDSLKAQSCRLGIVSNWSWNLRQRVTQAGLDGFFEIVWASAYAGCNKPHPRIFEQALSQMGIPTERALYVGDSYEHDVVGARNAGVDVILLDRDGTAGDLDCPVIRDLWGVFDWVGEGEDSA